MPKPHVNVTNRWEVPAKAPQAGASYGLSVNVAPPELPTVASGLSLPLQEIARQYIDARQRGGQALLDSARWMTEARQQAKSGDWHIFLTAIGSNDDAAERLLNIHALAMQNPQFADFVRINWIGQSAAALLALPSTPPQIIDQVLNAPEPMKVKEIRNAIKDAKPTSRTVERGGTVYQQKVKQPAPTPPAEQPNIPDLAPDFADILLRLDAHGYAKTTTRTKGMTTFYSFRDYRNNPEDSAGEVELAEGELSFWLAELDSNAAYAQAKQERYIDARDRAALLGYDLRRDGAQFVMTPAGQHVPALRGALDAQIKTIEGYERTAAKNAAADPGGSDRQLHLAKEARDAGVLERAQNLIAAGESAAARTILGGIEVATHARDQLLRTIPAGRTITLALTDDDCAALRRDAKLFTQRGYDHDCPAITNALVLLIEGMKLTD